MREKISILAIHDEPIFMRFIYFILKKAGFYVFQATSGKQGIGVFNHNIHEIDIVLMDYDLGDMNAPEIIGEIKKINPNQKIIIFTGGLLPRHDLGVRCVLEKPLQKIKIIIDVIFAVHYDFDLIED